MKEAKVNTTHVVWAQKLYHLLIASRMALMWYAQVVDTDDTNHFIWLYPQHRTIFSNKPRFLVTIQIKETSRRPGDWHQPHSEALVDGF